METHESIDKFVHHWGSKSTMTPIPYDEIEALEQKLSIILPDNYKYLLSTYGLVRSPNVFSKICDLNNANISDVQDFLSLEDVASLSKLYELSGMAPGHVLFASDSKGNMFCFKQSDCETQKPDISVWFFDYSSNQISKVNDSFSQWLEAFNKLA